MRCGCPAVIFDYVNFVALGRASPHATGEATSAHTGAALAWEPRARRKCCSAQPGLGHRQRLVLFQNAAGRVAFGLY
jgi:hypothetical protein